MKGNSFFIGVPVLPEHLYRHGIPEELERMQDLVKADTVMTFSHSHVFRQYRKDFEPLKDDGGRNITDVFVRTDPSLYPDSQMASGDPDALYADRDILDELFAEAEPRNMKVYARILEAYRITGAIPGLELMSEVDPHGAAGQNVCYNNPDYIQWQMSTLTDLVVNHAALAGFKYGSERGGPLLATLKGETPVCFCEHCIKLAKDRGINHEQARKGFIKLIDLGNKSRSESNDSQDSLIVSLLRLFGAYPEILAWEKLWMDSREMQRSRMYTHLKGLNSELQVGWHIDHGMTWDLFTRAFNDYSTMPTYSDWLSTAVYFDSMGRRSYNHFNNVYKNMLFKGVPEEAAYSTYLSLLGYDPEKQPELNRHRQKDTPFSADYVYKECHRAVKAVKGGCRIYGRVGFDMPGYDCGITPAQVYDAVTAALKAGVDGLWCGREWDELQEKNIRAFGKAVRDFWPK
jgi:hypothetical protein